MLKNKVVVVTGVGQGIVKEIAIACAQAGTLIIIDYRSSEEEARGVAEEIKADSRIAELFQADISKKEGPA